MAINDSFQKIYKNYKDCRDKVARERYVKQLIAAAYLMTQYNADTSARNTVLAIGNRFRNGVYKKLPRRDLRTLWRIANQPTGGEIKAIRKFIDLLIKGQAGRLFDRSQKPRKAKAKTPVTVEYKSRRRFNAPTNTSV